jgi:hypothetical protein
MTRTLYPGSRAGVARHFPYISNVHKQARRPPAVRVRVSAWQCTLFPRAYKGLQRVFNKILQMRNIFSFVVDCCIPRGQVRSGVRIKPNTINVHRLIAAGLIWVKRAACALPPSPATRGRMCPPAFCLNGRSVIFRPTRCSGAKPAFASRIDPNTPWVRS